MSTIVKADASGAVVASAKVTITETNTGVNRTMLTNESGNYTFSNIPPDNCRPGPLL